MTWQQDAIDFLNGKGKNSIEAGFNALKDEFMKFLNSSSDSIMNESNKTITLFQNNVINNTKNALSTEFTKALNSVNNNANLIKTEFANVAKNTQNEITNFTDVLKQDVNTNLNLIKNKTTDEINAISDQSINKINESSKNIINIGNQIQDKSNVILQKTQTDITNLGNKISNQIQDKRNVI